MDRLAIIRFVWAVPRHGRRSMLRHLRMSVRRRAMSAATGMMRLIMLPLIAATSIVRLTPLPSIVVMNTPGLIMPPIIESMTVMGSTLLRPIIEATCIGIRELRSRGTPCQTI